jgi:hypothetical protein
MAMKNKTESDIFRVIMADEQTSDKEDLAQDLGEGVVD